MSPRLQNELAIERAKCSMDLYCVNEVFYENESQMKESSGNHGI